MKKLPYTLRCAQGAALPVCLLGPVREPLTPSLYANRRKSQVPCAREEGDMLEVLGRIGLGVCLCGYAAIVLWVWGWDKRKDRRERRHGESSDKTGAVQQGNVQGAHSSASASAFAVKSRKFCFSGLFSCGVWDRVRPVRRSPSGRRHENPCAHKTRSPAGFVR